VGEKFTPGVITPWGKISQIGPEEAFLLNGTPLAKKKTPRGGVFFFAGGEETLLPPRKKSAVFFFIFGAEKKTRTRWRGTYPALIGVRRA